MRNAKRLFNINSLNMWHLSGFKELFGVSLVGTENINRIHCIIFPKLVWMNCLYKTITLGETFPALGGWRCYRGLFVYPENPDSRILRHRVHRHVIGQFHRNRENQHDKFL